MILGVVVAWLAVTATDSRKEEADLCMRRGKDAYRAGQFDTAIREYQRGYDLFPSPKILFNLGLAYEEGARKPEALATFERFLRELARESEQFRRQLAQEAAKADARVQRLRKELSEGGGSSGSNSTLGGEHALRLSPAPPAPNLREQRSNLLPAFGPQAAVVERSPRRVPWWAVAAGAVAVATAATTFFLVWGRRNSCSAEYWGCF